MRKLERRMSWTVLCVPGGSDRNGVPAADGQRLVDPVRSSRGASVVRTRRTLAYSVLASRGRRRRRRHFVGRGHVSGWRGQRRHVGIEARAGSEAVDWMDEKSGAADPEVTGRPTRLGQSRRCSGFSEPGTVGSWPASENFRFDGIDPYGKMNRPSFGTHAQAESPAGYCVMLYRPQQFSPQV